MNIAFSFAVVLTGALALAACEDRASTYRYKLTLSLNTPDGVKTGFNIVEVTGFAGGVNGQALYVDMGAGRKPLIALLSRIRRKADDYYYKPQNFYYGRWFGFDPALVFARYCLKAAVQGGRLALPGAINANCRQPFTLPVDALPDLVTFTDINDPKTIALVDPTDLAATLGPAVSWRSATLEAIDYWWFSPLTKDVDTRLRWVRELGGEQLNIPTPTWWPQGDSRFSPGVLVADFIGRPVGPR